MGKCDLCGAVVSFSFNRECKFPPEVVAAFKETQINLRNTVKLAYDWAISKGIPEACARNLCPSRFAFGSEPNSPGDEL